MADSHKARIYPFRFDTKNLKNKIGLNCFRSDACETNVGGIAPEGNEYNNIFGESKCSKKVMAKLRRVKRKKQVMISMNVETRKMAGLSLLLNIIADLIVSVLHTNDSFDFCCALIIKKT